MQRVSRQKWLGFTLIEILIAVALVTIISAIAIPSYNNYILRSRRSEAVTNLLRIQAAYEEYYAQNNTYPAANTLPPTGTTPIPSTTYYTYTSTVGTGYTLTATAIASTGQNADTQFGTSCATLTITNTGVTTPLACWNQ